MNQRSFIFLLACLSVCAVNADIFISNFQRPFSVPNERIATVDTLTESGPNAASTLEITAHGTLPNCSGNAYTAGYVHFTSGESKKEDKHMFWWFFESRRDPENAPLLLTFGGGPGTAGSLTSFAGIGPCLAVIGEEGKPFAIPNEATWTSDINLLAIDHPVGVGYSYGDNLRNSSASAALDVDDLLQVFWKQYPHLVKNKFIIGSGSYGGTYIPHIVNTIHTRNKDRAIDDRISKMPDSIMMSNVWSDAQTMIRWYHDSNCGVGKDSNPFLNSTTCSELASATARGLDAIQLAYEQPILEYQMDAMEPVGEIMTTMSLATSRDIYDFREICPTGGCDPLKKLRQVQEFINSTEVKNLIGVPGELDYEIVSERISEKFIMNGDYIQASYKLLAPAIEDGLRMMVYNGMADGVATWRASFSWMKLLQTKHQREFREAKEINYPLEYSVQRAGQGEAGEYTFVKIQNAGHFVVAHRSDLVKELMLRWIHNKSMNVTQTIATNP